MSRNSSPGGWLAGEEVPNQWGTFGGGGGQKNSGCLREATVLGAVIATFTTVLVKLAARAARR